MKRGDEEFLTEEKLAVIFDEEMQRDLLSLLEFYQSSQSISNETSSILDLKYKEAVSKVSQFTFLSKESLEKNVIKPFLALNNSKPIPEGLELTEALLEFYYHERIATIQIISWLLSPSNSIVVKPELLAFCRAILKNLMSRGLLEKSCAQLLNLSLTALPLNISKENRNELSFSWIHQNILEQKELAKLIFELISSNIIKFNSETSSKIIFDLVRGNFGLNNFERYNLDSETISLAREAFWFRQSIAIRILDLKGIISSSISTKNILEALSPLKTSDLVKIFSAFKPELTHELTGPFKFSWSLLVGFMDSLEILDNAELKIEYPKIASNSIDSGFFKIVVELLDGNNFISESPAIRTSLKSLFKDIYTAFLTIFDADRSVNHLPIVTEGLIHIFTDESELCEEFWYVDSQSPSRTSVLKYWMNRFPHDFITLIRLLRALSAGFTCAEIVSDLLFKGFDHIYVERSSDRGNVIEEYDLSAEIYNLTVNKTMEIHSCGIGLILESGTKGVMMAGFNEHPMVNWSAKVSPFHFLLRILQISQDFGVNFYILELLERFSQDLNDFPELIYAHLQIATPIFTQSKTKNFPITLIELLLFVLEQPNPNALIMSKCLNCLVALDKVLDSDFFAQFIQNSSALMDGITKVLNRCVYNVEIDAETFQIFDSVIKFSDTILVLCTSFKDEFSDDCSVLLKCLKESIFAFIIEHVGKWRFFSQVHRIRLLADVCRMILTFEKHSISIDGFSIGCNFALLNAIIFLIHDVNQDQDHFSTPQIFIDNKIELSDYFQCLTRAIEFASGDNILNAAEYFGNAHIASPAGPQSPFNIIANSLSLNYMVQPVLLFFQYVFQNDQFALNVRISRDSLEILSSCMCKWFTSTDSREILPKIRSAALAVLNNISCTRPDLFLFIFGQSEESFVKLFVEGISRNVFDYETMLLTGICSVLWSSVADFTMVINVFKRKSPELIEKMVKLLSNEWAESGTPTALKIVSSIFEVLAVELCYFNSSPKIPSSISIHLKSSYDPEKFVKKVLLFQTEFPESFVTFAESYAIFASSCLALEGEEEFNRKILPSLIFIIEKLSSDWDSNHEIIEMICRVLNFGLLQIQGFTGKDCYTLLGHELFNSLVGNVLRIISSPMDDLNKDTDERFETVSVTGTLLNNNLNENNFNWTHEQTTQLFEMIGIVLNVLRHFLVLQSRDSKKVSSFLNLLINSLSSLATNQTELIHFIRREGILKTIFSLIRNYRDTNALILFSAGLFKKFDFIVEEFLSSEILENFIIEESELDDFFLEFISLLSIIKIRFDSNCAVSERICTVLYSCNIQDRLNLLLKIPIDQFKKKEFEFFERILPLFKLISNSLEKPIESQATEALLSNLLECFFNLSIKLISSEASKEQCDLLNNLISSLAYFNLYARPKYLLRRQFQNLLFPYSHFNIETKTTNTNNYQRNQIFTTSQYASALHLLISTSKDEKTIEFCKQILKLNCPEILKNELELNLSSKND